MMSKDQGVIAEMDEIEEQTTKTQAPGSGRHARGRPRNGRLPRFLTADRR